MRLGEGRNQSSQCQARVPEGLRPGGYCLGWPRPHSLDTDKYQDQVSLSTAHPAGKYLDVFQPQEVEKKTSFFPCLCALFASLRVKI